MSGAFQRTIQMAHHPDEPEPTRLWLVMQDGTTVELSRLWPGEWSVPCGTSGAFDETEVVAARIETPFDASMALSEGEQVPDWATRGNN